MLNLKNLSEKQALAYTIIATIVLCLLPFLWLLWAQYETGSGTFANIIENPENLSTTLNKLQQEKAALEATLGQEKKLTEELNLLENEAERYKQALPDEENVEDIYKLVGDSIVAMGRPPVKGIISPKRERATPAKVTPQAAKGAPTATGKKYPVDYVETTWKIEGSYQIIMNILHTIEDVNFKRFSMITDLRLTPIANAGTKEEPVLDYLSADFTLVSFFLTNNTEKKEEPKK